MQRWLALILLVLATSTRPADAKDELVLAMTQAPGTMNPLNNATLAQSLILNMTNRPFTAYDPDWRLVCVVCTELPTLKNGMARLIDLSDGRKGMEIDVEIRPLRWADGKAVTTRDVAFTIEAGKHPQSGVVSAEGFRRIVKLDIKDDRRFTLTLDRATFNYNHIGMRLLPAHVEKSIFDANPDEYRKRNSFDATPANPGLSFGPYRVVELVPGNRIVLEQNSAWTGERPHFSRLIVKLIENTAALEANLMSGNIDYALGELGFSLDQVLAFEKRYRNEFNFVYKPALVYEHIDVNLDNPLLVDRRVRQAMLMSIDRKLISEKLFEGKQPVADGSISPLDPMFSTASRHYGYDLATARRLLDDAGFAETANGVRVSSGGERLSLELTTTAGNRAREQMAVVIQSMLRKVGIELRIKAQPPRVFSEAMGRRGFTGLAMYAWVEHPQDLARATLHSQEIPSAANGWSGANFPGYRNPRIDQLLDATERELDTDKRRALFADIQRILSNDLPALPLFFRVDAYVIPKPLKGIRPTGHSVGSTLWIEQWRWAD